MARTFEYAPAVRQTLPLLIGVAGPTGSGKTFSALRMATGMQKVSGGDIALIDTEAKRGTAYDQFFKFNHLDFAPPFGPLDYIEAIDHCIKKGARHIVIDSMTHEHSGPGGVMDQIDQWLEEKCGNDWGKRDKLNMMAHKGPKADRKALNNFIIQAGRGGVNFIFCYRADDKVKPVAGKGIQSVGMTPETTSKLVYEMMAMFLLTPSSDGKPNMNPGTDAEKLLTKSPVQFRDMLHAGEQLSENLGAKFAEWARGGSAKVAASAAQKQATAPDSSLDEAIFAAEAVGETKAREGLASLGAWWKTLPSAVQLALTKKKDQEWKPTAEGVTP